MPTQRKRVTPVKVGPPKTVPISDDDYRLAVHTLAGMIADWWASNSRIEPEPPVQADRSPC